MTSSSPPRSGPRNDLPDTYGSTGSLSSAAAAHNNKNLRLRPPRTLPPWIDSYDEKYGSVGDEQLKLLNPPAPAVQPQHNSSPADPQRRVSKDGFVDPHDPLHGQGRETTSRLTHVLRYGRASMRGRKWDHLRTAEPVIVPGFAPKKAMMPQPGITWQDFLGSSRYGHMSHEESRLFDPDVLDELQPGFNAPNYQPYNATEALKMSRRRRTLAPYKRIWNMAVRHSLAPLIFRLAVMVTSIVALGLSSRIYHLQDKLSDGNSAEKTQTIVAVVVDCVAIPYIGYMIWDEYTGKPLGLRSVKSKISLILLDLFFIIFKSVSTALAFESVVYHSIDLDASRRLVNALAAFMLIGLLLWAMNFAVNIFRTVERLGGGEDE